VIEGLLAIHADDRLGQPVLCLVEVEDMDMGTLMLDRVSWRQAGSVSGGAGELSDPVGDENMLVLMELEEVLGRDGV
jgi:hypothetical protein